MPPTLTVRRSAARGWGLVQFGLFPMAGGVFFTVMSLGRKDADLLSFLPLVVFSGAGLLLVGIGLGMVADRSPKLSADGAGLFNHMSPAGGNSSRGARSGASTAPSTRSTPAGTWGG